MSSRKRRYLDEEESDNQFSSVRSGHSRTNTRTKLTPTQLNNMIDLSSETSGYPNIKDVSSDEEDKLSKKYNGLKFEIAKVELQQEDEVKNNKGSNALLKALNRRKAENILNFNAASNKIPEPEPEIKHEVLGLSDDQIEYKRHTN